MRLINTNYHKGRDTERLGDLYALIKLFILATLAALFFIVDQVRAEAANTLQMPAVETISKHTLACSIDDFSTEAEEGSVFSNQLNKELDHFYKRTVN